ncbi:MAG TPA: MBL fold metallo-hydrolase [Candidatus Syntrophoarchaeum butanivorans]|uniref:MBL fold metallo-hydrolase n=1 Tax=Candidatus Syntropharchaeum butanivorans TaxID=1839936 RepID=A0A1F2P401_9EURY|nr:MAG: Zn-dependent hydrolase [Candidatus Syntrophoarchaeum butanivorans]HDM37057.1 MBL fold metallo-hydrolase [Candidatus Syntrophoarchaeum butanivorans]HEC56749.1 MBL fold metallo-hydrolase [Candidatus Syntrophoarchaeum butanivorans]
MRITDRIYWYPEQGMLDCNTYLVVDDEITLLVDPGNSVYMGRLLKELRRDGFEPKDIDLITITHLHIDHCGANQNLRDVSGAKIAIHEVQAKNRNIFDEVSRFFGLNSPDFTEDLLLRDTLYTGSKEIKMIPTPGHSPESVCFYDPVDKVLISGDVIFDRSVGRTDLPHGNGMELKKSIINLSTLDIEYLLPGHMGIVRGREAVRKNFEFVRDFYFRFI